MLNTEQFMVMVDSYYLEGSVDKSDIYNACKEAYLMGQGSVGTHDPDCSLHNAPALPVGPCDCRMLRE